MWARGDLHIPPEKREWYADAPGLRRRRKRFRHARRYYRRLRREVESFRIPGPDTWFDLWHTHPDWEGDGNRGPRHRRRHLRAGFDLFQAALRQAPEVPRPVQVFLVIDALDSSQDAVHVHSENPNRDNYPFDFPGVAWDVPAPVILREFLAERPEWQLGRSPGSPGHYWVRPRPA